MKFPLPADPFPTLTFSPDDKRRIEDAAEAMVKNTIEQYHAHLTVDNGVVDEKFWRKVKQREDVRVYRERVSSSESPDDTASSSSESSLDVPKTMIAMLTFGSIQGTLDDVMYGILNPSTETMQLRTAYIENGFVDWAMLASIIKPSEKDPFRELSLKWVVKGHPNLIGAVMRTRDVVYIESSGIALTPNGERIGYHVNNSVDIPEIRELAEFKIVRVKVSVCEFYRQRNDNSVEVYARTTFFPMGDAPASLAASSGAEAEVAISKHVHCAEMKKLRRIVGSRGQLALRSTAASTDLSSLESSRNLDVGFGESGSSSSTACALCTQPAGGGLTFTSSKLRHCRICSARACSRCRVTKTLFLPTAQEKKLRSEDMVFCTRCVLVSSYASSAKFAVLDALAAEGTTVDYSEALQ